MKILHRRLKRDPPVAALDAAPNVAFRNGLGNLLFASRPVSLDAVKAYAARVFTKENVAVIGPGVRDDDGAVQNKLSSPLSGSQIDSTKATNT